MNVDLPSVVFIFIQWDIFTGYLLLHRGRLLATFRLGLYTSYNLIQKYPHRHSQRFLSEVVLDLVNKTLNTGQHNSSIPSQVNDINTPIFFITLHLHLHRLRAISQCKMHPDQLHKSVPSLAIPAVLKGVRRPGEMARHTEARQPEFGSLECI